MELSLAMRVVLHLDLELGISEEDFCVENPAIYFIAQFIQLFQLLVDPLLHFFSLYMICFGLCFAFLRLILE